MNAKKQTLLNISAYVILPLFIGVFNILKMRIFITALGETQNGIYQFYTSFFTYFALIESGMELSVCSTLYKYLNNHNHQKVNEVIAGAKTFWWRFAFGNLIIGGLLLPLAPVLVGSDPSIWFVITIQALYTIRSTFNYFFAGPQTMAMADNKGYLVILIDTISTFTSAASAIAIVLLTGNLIYVAIAEVLILLIFVTIKYVYLKSKFPYLQMNYNKKKSFEFKGMLKGTLANKVTDMFINNTDIFIVTLMFGVKANSWFTIFISFSTILISIFGTSITTSFQSLLGKNFADKNYQQEDKKLNIALLKLLNYLIISIAIPLIAVAINPFVDLFYGETQVAPLTFYLVWLIFIYFKLIKTPYMTLKVSMGMYNKFIPFSIMNAIVKVILSVIFGLIWGMTGVLIGTAVSYIITELWKEAKEFDIKILGKPWLQYAGELVIHFTLTLLTSFIIIKYATPMINSFLSWFIICAVVGLVLIASVGAIYFAVSKQLRAFIKQFIGGK